MLIFDLETDGLLDDVTKIHCMVTHDRTSVGHMHIMTIYSEA